MLNRISKSVYIEKIILSSQKNNYDISADKAIDLLLYIDVNERKTTKTAV